MADAILVNNVDDDLMQPSSFMGVSGGLMPGAYFVLRPNLGEMQRMMNVLFRTHGNYRFAEMTFLNIYFGPLISQSVMASKTTSLGVFPNRIFAP